MKNKSLNLLKYGLILMFFFSVSSCEWVDPDINVNPDTPTEVPMAFILPSIQADMAYDIGGNDIVRVTNMWMQYFNGYARQSLSHGRYIYTPSDANNVWNNMYYGILADIKQLKMQAEETNSVHFLGVANVLNAVSLMTLADLWGDIPWSEAMQGGANLSPAPDSQESVYQVIMGMLDDAIDQLQEDNQGPPLDGDVIYDGDVDKWLGAAYAVKARAILVQSKRNANAYTEVLAVLDEGGLSSNSDNMVLYFTAAVAHPLSQFMSERGDLTMGKTFVDMLIADEDPRAPFYIDGPQVGGVIGSESDDGFGEPGDYAAADNAGVYFMTYAEQKFIEAEALLGSDIDAAYDAYIEGTMHSLLQVGVDTTGITATNFYTNLTAGGAASLNLERIIRQKYIASYNTMYAYNDHRRTGYPTEVTAVLPVEANFNQMPRRMPYGQSEITYNANISPQSITGRVWWDAE